MSHDRERTRTRAVTQWLSRTLSIVQIGYTGNETWRWGVRESTDKSVLSLGAGVLVARARRGARDGRESHERERLAPGARQRNTHKAETKSGRPETPRASGTRGRRAEGLAYSLRFLCSVLSNLMKAYGLATVSTAVRQSAVPLSRRTYARDRALTREEKSTRARATARERTRELARVAIQQHEIERPRRGSVVPPRRRGQRPLPGSGR